MLPQSISLSYGKWQLRSGSLTPSEMRTRAHIRPAQPGSPPHPGAHTGHAVEFPALFFRQDVIQENPLSPIQLRRVIDKRDVLIEQRAAWRNRTHCLLCYLCSQGGKRRTPNSLQCAIHETQFAHECLRRQRQIRSLMSSKWIQEKKRDVWLPGFSTTSQ